MDELRFSIKGDQISAHGSFSANSRPVGHVLKVYGTRNTVQVDYANRTVTLDPIQKVPSALGRLLPSFNQSWQYFRQASKNLVLFGKCSFNYFAGMGNLIKLFYDSILSDGPVPISYSDILRVARFMDRIHDQVYPAKKGGGEP
jgi:hypothetical protein